MNMTLPSAVLHAITLLNNAGFEAYAVGGCVRDSLLGNQPADWDIATSALPAEMQLIFSAFHTIETGLRHGTLTVIIEQVSLEITTYRIDGDYSDGRHPDAVLFTRSLTEDLRRRDFTVNAMAYHPETGLIDLYGGQTDLTARIIRCVGEPEQRFSEDALRILRALRFASTLGFSIEEKTETALIALASNLGCVSAERIAVEIKKLISGIDACRILQTYRSVMSVILPEIVNCDDFSMLCRLPTSVRTRFASLFYTANVSAKDAETALRRLRIDNRTIREVSLLLTPQTNTFDNVESYVLHLLNRFGPDLIYDYLSIHSENEETARCADRLLESNACYQLSMLAITGDDIIATGIKPGPAVGQVLESLLNAVMDGTCPNEKEALLNHVKNNKKPVQ